MESRLIELTNELAITHVDDEPSVKEYYDLKKQLNKFQQDAQKVITHPGHILPYLQSGRVVKVKVGEHDYGWGMVQSFNKRQTKRSSVVYSDHESYIVQVFIYSMFVDSPVNLIKPFNPELPEGIRPSKPGEKSRAEYIPITLNSIQQISSVRLKVPTDFKSSSAKRNLLKTLKDLPKKFPDGIPIMDPVTSMKINDDEFKLLLRKIDVVDSKIMKNPIHGSVRLNELYEKYDNKVKIEEEMKSLKDKILETQAVIQLDDLKYRKRVLRRLGFTTQNDIIELKGRVACEISTGDELLLTELIFNGTFNELTSEQCAALLSCCVFQEKAKETPRLKPELAEPLKNLQDMALKIAKISKECKIEIIEKDYVESFRPELMEVTYAWCKNATFTQICKMTDVYEGSIIRTFKRLEEMIRQMVSAAKTIGNSELEQKMEKAMELVHRDIVSAGSLYL